MDYDGKQYSKSLTQLISWMDFPEAKFYSGEMKYHTTFKIADDYIGGKIILDLGELYESAEIFINGDFAGAVWTTPKILDITDKIKQSDNSVEIRVRNLLANRIIYLDRTGVYWRKYFFVNIDYKPFDASNWKLFPSGLIGNVQIILLGKR